MTKEEPKGLILVTGATGQHGGTGAHVVRALLEKGHHVRVLARRRSTKTEQLETAGAEILIADLHDRTSLVRAFDGVSQATFTYPIADGAVEAAANFAAAARQAGTKPRVVVTSMAVAHPDSPSHLGRKQWLAEEMLSWAGLELCVLRIAALYFENIAMLHARSIREENVIRNSFGTVQVPWISGRDAANLVVSALLMPERFGGDHVHYPVGVQLMDHVQIARLIGEHLGREIRFAPVTSKEWADELMELALRDQDGPVNVDMARHIAAVGAALASGKGPIGQPDSRELARLTGVKPLTIEDYLLREPALSGLPT